MPVMRLLKSGNCLSTAIFYPDELIKFRVSYARKDCPFILTPALSLVWDSVKIYDIEIILLRVLHK